MDEKQLSPNFKLSEFLVSQTAARVHISWHRPDPKPVRQVLIIDANGTQVV
jgi:hypothetical protein